MKIWFACILYRNSAFKIVKPTDAAFRCHLTFMYFESKFLQNFNWTVLFVNFTYIFLSSIVVLYQTGYTRMELTLYRVNKGNHILCNDSYGHKVGYEMSTMTSICKYRAELES